MRQPYLFSILFFAFLTARSQDVNQTYLDTFDSIQSGSVVLTVHNNNFLKNNEYFNRYTEGITYFGSQIQPELSYAFTDKTRLSVGWFLKYYYGTERFTSSIPVFRFEYDIMPGARLTFGQLNGLLAHDLIEPIYSIDNYFKRNPENGIELQIDRSRIHSSLWISWDHFILPGENSKEEISSGINTSWQIFNLNGKHSLSLNLQGIIHHFGGQVDNSDSPLETRLNLAPGMEFDFHPGNSGKTNCVFASYLIQSSDQSSTVTIPYKKGWASYSFVTVKHRSVTLAAAWFHGEYYFAPLGDRLFQSISELNDWYEWDTRNMLNGKFLFEHKIGKVKLGIRFDAYYDLDKKNIDYWYGMNIKTDADWLLWPSRKKK
jgi:hypothetical protein